MRKTIDADRAGGQPRLLSLRARFFLGIGIILLLFCSASAYFVYRQGMLLVEEAAHEKSQIVMSAVEASRAYVREVLRPRIAGIVGKEAFVLEAMSTSFVSRAIMDRFNASMPEYNYRRVAVNARNPSFEASPTEVRMIKYFGSNPDKGDWHGIMQMGPESQYVRFRPVYFEPSCLWCHGSVEDAPADLIELYGRERGFGHKEGDLAGVVAIGMPVDVALARIKDKAVSVFMSSLFIGGILFAVIGSFFNALVASDLKRILRIFREELPEEEVRPSVPRESGEAAVGLGEVPESLRWADELTLFERVRGRDEIDEITVSAQTMAKSLRENRKQLEDNARNLEQTVSERTSELRESEARLREQINSRNRELGCLNALAELTARAASLDEILPRVVEQTMTLIPARGAGLYLLKEEKSGSVLDLRYKHNASELPDLVPFSPDTCPGPPGGPGSAQQRAACGQIGFSNGHGRLSELHIPLRCRGRVLGVLSFCDVDFPAMGPELRELLFSIGRQIGIAVESLQNVAELLHGKELLQSVFDGITDVVVLMDADFRIRMVNKAHLKRYDITQEEALGRFCYELHSGTMCPFPNCGMQKVLQAKKPVIEEIQSGNGEIFLIHFYPVLDEKGEVESIVRYARDITEQKRIEQNIQKTEKLASLGQLAAGIAHEINNPLGVILTYTDLLKQQLENMPEAFEDVETIGRHATTCKRIVSDLLGFSRGETAKRQLASVNRGIEDAIRMVDHAFGKKSITVKCELDLDLPLINMDIDKIRQVWVNLLMNAQQAIEEQGEIRISTCFIEETGQVRVTVRDSGKGIEAELLSKIFDPFFSTKAAGEGTGLGLSVSYGIIRDHCGEIHAISDPGNWTEFIVLLPVDECS